MTAVKAASLVSLTFLSLLSIASTVLNVGCGSMNTPPSAGQGAGGSSSGAGGAGETLCGNVSLSETRTVAVGETLTICAGSTVTAASDVSLTVEGTLQIQGTAQKPVKLIGATDAPGAWTGLVLDAGGQVTATYLEIHGADTAVAARPGSMYSLDHLVIDTSSMMLVLSSNGTIGHGTLRGLGDSQFGTPVLITNASPQITNTSVTQALFGGIDMIVVDGSASAPLFDHLEVADSHCAFHFNQSNGATISNSFVHHNAYGLMVVSSLAGHIDHNNFEDNGTNIGSCAPSASEEVSGNYFAGVPFGDGSCQMLTVTGTTPAGPYTTGVGPAL
jgi:hypothetical protein